MASETEAGQRHASVGGLVLPLGSLSSFRPTLWQLELESRSLLSIPAEKISQVVRLAIDRALERLRQASARGEIQCCMERAFCLFHVRRPSRRVLRSFRRAAESDTRGQLRVDQAVLKNLLRPHARSSCAPQTGNVRPRS